jgi:hypothetical protein
VPRRKAAAEKGSGVGKPRRRKRAAEEKGGGGKARWSKVAPEGIGAVRKEWGQKGEHR